MELGLFNNSLLPKSWVGYFLLLVTAQLGSSLAYADGSQEGILVNPAFSVRQVTNISSGDQTDYLFSLGAGYRLADGWYFGLLYSSTSSNGVDSANEYDIGNSVGYFYGPVSFVASIYLLADRVEKTSTANIHWGGGWGTQLDLSYMLPSGHGFDFGPTLSYRSISFATEDNHTGSEQSVSHNETYLYPYIGFIFIF
jgi:hypothetical protein